MKVDGAGLCRRHTLRAKANGDSIVVYLARHSLPCASLWMAWMRAAVSCAARSSICCGGPPSSHGASAAEIEGLLYLGYMH